jgi:hypothetical protein
VEYIRGVIFYLLEIFTAGRVGRRVIYYLFEIFQNDIPRGSSLTTVVEVEYFSKKKEDTAMA